MNKLIEKIASGELTSERIGKESVWTSVSSLRLLTESGQTLTEEATKEIKALPAKWFYWTLKSNNNEGNIIIKFFVKKTKEEGYAIVSNTTGQILEAFDTIQEAKTHFINNFKI